MKDNKKLEKQFDVNIKLNTLYEILDGYYSPLENDYPSDVKKCMEDLINKLNDYLYHPIDGYDIVGEKYYTTVIYQKNS